MAFYDPQEDEDQQSVNAQVPGVQTQSGSSVITGNSAGAGAASPQTKTNSPDRPGSFVNLQDYLNANKTQSEKLGNQASSVIDNSATQARQGVSDLNQEAQTKIQPTSYLSSDVSDKIKNGAESLNPDERQAVKKTESATYQGPQSYADLSSYQAASDANQKAVQNINDSGTEQGRMNLIGQINSKPRTQGMNVFDNALLQAGSGRDKLAQSSLANQDVKGALDTADQNIQNQIGRVDDPSTPDIDESSGAIGQTTKAQADANKQVQDALNAWKTGFTPKVQEQQTQFTNGLNDLSHDISDDPLNLSDSAMQALGLNRGTTLYNTNLSNYLNASGVNDISAANVASPEDYARYAALADLSGDQSNILDPANASKAGSLPGMADFQKLQSDLQAAQGKYDQRYSQGGRDQTVLNSDRLAKLGWSTNYNDWVEQLHRDGIATKGDIYSASPAEIENYWIPLFQNNTSGGPYSQTIAKALGDSISEFKGLQGANQVVNGYGLNGDMPNQPNVPGHIINRIK